MATVTRENIGLLNEKLVVKVEKDDYLPSFQKAIKDYSKKANIPGFRKGMVPVGMVKKMYGSSVFADEVIKSVEKGLSEYMETEKLQIFAQPLPLPDNDSSRLNMDQPAEYQFAFEVGLKPDFTVTDLATADFTFYKIDVTDEMINSEIDKLQERMATTTEEESITDGENELLLEFVECDANGIEITDGINKSTSFLVKDFTPKSQEELIGKKKEESLKVQLSQSFVEKDRQSIMKTLGLNDESDDEASKYFNIIIKGISARSNPLLDTAFFVKIFPDEEILTEDAFRERMKKAIEQEWAVSSRNQFQDQIYHKLLHTPIEFPEDFLKRWMLHGTDKEKSPEEVEREFPKFVDQLKWTLITEKLVRENDIVVKPEDLRNFAKAQLMSYMGGSNINLDQPWMSEYVDRMMKDKKFLEDSFHRVETEKIFEWAETRVKPTEVTISEEDFTKLLEEHKHEH